MKRCVVRGIASLVIVFWGGSVLSHDSVDPSYFCERLVELEHIPLKESLSSDPVYNGVIAAGPRILPCLVSMATDERKMLQPVKYKHHDIVMVYELVFVLVDKLFVLGGQVGEPIEGLLLEDSLAGTFRWLESCENRMIFRQKLKVWLSSYKADLRSNLFGRCSSNQDFQYSEALCYNEKGL